MKNYTKIAIAVLALLFIMLLSLPYLLNLNGLKLRINEISNKIIEAEAKDAYLAGETFLNIKGKIKLKTIPSFRLVISDIEGKRLRLNNTSLDFQIPKMELYVSPIKLLFGKFSVKKIKFIKANYYVNEFDIDNKNKARLNNTNQTNTKIDKRQFIKIYEAINKEILEQENFTFSKTKVFLQKSNLYATFFANTLEFLNTNLALDFSDGFSVNGTAELNNEIVNFESKANSSRRKKEFEGEIDVFSSIVRWSFKYAGSYGEPFGLDTLKMNSTSALDIKDIQLFAKWFFNKNTWQYKKLISDESLKLTFAFLFDSGSFHAKDINLTATNINGTGDFIFDATNQGQSQMLLNFPMVNLDKLITKGFASDEQFSPQDVKIFSQEIKNVIGAYKKADEGIAYLSFFEYFPFRKSDFKIGVTIDKILYNDKNIDSVVFNANTTNKGLLKVDGFTFTLPKNGQFALQGEGDYSYEDKGFVGNITIKGEDLREIFSMLNIKTSNIDEQYLKNFSFNGQVNSLGDRTYVKNFKFNFDDISSVGDLEIATNGGIKYFATNIDINQFDIARYISSNLGALEGGTLKEKLLWLNSFNVNTLLKVNVEQLIYKNYVENNYSFKISYGQGFLNFSDLDLFSKYFRVKGDFGFDIRTENPRFDANLYFTKLYAFSGKLNSAEKTIQAESEDPFARAPDKAPKANTQNSETVKANYKDLVDLLMSCPSLFGFDGKISVGIEKGTIEGIDVSEAQFISTIKGGQLNLDTVTFKAFDGGCKLKGGIGIQKDKSVNLALDGCTFESSEFLKYLTGRQNIKGKFATSGILVASGANHKTFLDKMEGRFNVKGIGITVEEFGLKDLMLEMFGMSQDAIALNKFNAQNTLRDKKKNTPFKDVDGIVQIKSRNILYKLNLKGVALTGATNGKISDNKLESFATFIFLTGTKSKQVPMGLTAKISGDLKNLQTTLNASQIDRYVNKLKGIVVEEEPEEEMEEIFIEDETPTEPVLKTYEPETTPVESETQTPLGYEEMIPAVLEEIPAESETIMPSETTETLSPESEEFEVIEFEEIEPSETDTTETFEQEGTEPAIQTEEGEPMIEIEEGEPTESTGQ